MKKITSLKKETLKDTKFCELLEYQSKKLTEEIISHAEWMASIWQAYIDRENFLWPIH